ncbi:MAG: hypothetical protein WC875_05030 [Candidatus Absconditabacterales bacterium]
MATPITHIVLMDKIYEEQFGICDKKDFLLGTLLPDIRYLDKSISRESTHSYDITLDAVKSASTCFDKGMLFHSLVDHVRDEFYISKGIYIRGGDEEFIIALKLLEDQYLYNKIKNWDEYVSFLDIIPYEKMPDIKKEILDKRYAMIKQELIDGPSDSVRKAFRAGLGIIGEYPDKINALIYTLQKDEKILKLINEFYEFYELFGSLIKK